MDSSTNFAPVVMETENESNISSVSTTDGSLLSTDSTLLEEAQSKIKQLEDDIRTYRNQPVVATDAAVNEVSLDADSIRDYAASLEEEVRRKTEEIDALVTEKDQIFQQLEIEMGANSEHEEELQNQIECLGAENKTLQSVVESLKEMHENQINDLKSKISNFAVVACPSPQQDNSTKEDQAMKDHILLLEEDLRVSSQFTDMVLAQLEEMKVSKAEIEAELARVESELIKRGTEVASPDAFRMEAEDERDIGEDVTISNESFVDDDKLKLLMVVQELETKLEEAEASLSSTQSSKDDLIKTNLFLEAKTIELQKANEQLTEQVILVTVYPIMFLCVSLHRLRS
jgi:DNA repair exonuclease SbcCD ATPase subunit